LFRIVCDTLKSILFLIALLTGGLQGGSAWSGAGGDIRILAKGTHPFVDRALIDQGRGVTHLLHPPVPRNVVLTLDKPWEGKMGGYAKVLRDPDGKVRLYYRGGGDVDPPEVTCVAFSNDGVTFTRPRLDLYQIRGTRQNNVVFTAADRPSYGESHNFAPFLDTNPAAPADGRWKAVALKFDNDDAGQKQRMLTVLSSPDGLHWKPLADRPVIRQGSFDSLNIAFFDSNDNQYVCYYRVGRSGMRSFARAISSDFVSWKIDDPLEFRPAQDEQWYTNGVSPYPGVANLYLAMPMRFVPERRTVGVPPRPTDGLSDAVMMTSRNGRTWDRCFREAFIRPGSDPDNWGDAHGNNTPLAGVIETTAGEWSIYWFEGGVTGTPRIRRGTVRADGLASLHAGAEGGEIITSLLHLHDGPQTTSLRINFATSAVGSIRVEILGQDNKPISGFAAADCAEIYGDEGARPVTWRAGSALPVGANFRLRFMLRDADLYALTLD
jgi:hypothetical protein